MNLHLSLKKIVKIVQWVTLLSLTACEIKIGQIDYVEKPETVNEQADLSSGKKETTNTKK